MKNAMALVATLSMCLSLAVPALANCKDESDCCKDKAAGSKKQCNKAAKSSCPKKNKEASTDSKTGDAKSGDAKTGEVKDGAAKTE